MLNTVLATDSTNFVGILAAVFFLDSQPTHVSHTSNAQIHDPFRSPHDVDHHVCLGDEPHIVFV